MLTINMGQMVQALGYKPFATSACLAIFSVSQALARVAAGAISESALEWPTRIFGINGVPRTAFLVLSCAFAVGGHASFAVAGNHRALFVLGIVLTVRENGLAIVFVNRIGWNSSPTSPYCCS